MDIFILLLGLITLSVVFIAWQLRFSVNIGSNISHLMYEAAYGGYMWIRTGELPVHVFNNDIAKIAKENGANVVTEDLICIGKRTKNGFIPSKFLLTAMSSKNIEIRRLVTGAYLNESTGQVDHPGQCHYRIFKRGILYHGHDSKMEETPSNHYISSLYWKWKFKRKFEDEWKNASIINKENIITAYNGKFLIRGDTKYEYASDEEIEEFKRNLKEI